MGPRRSPSNSSISNDKSRSTRSKAEKQLNNGSGENVSREKVSVGTESQLKRNASPGFDRWANSASLLLRSNSKETRS